MILPDVDELSNACLVNTFEEKLMIFFTEHLRSDNFTHGSFALQKMPSVLIKRVAKKVKA